jgi:hypothetical protein
MSTSNPLSEEDPSRQRNELDGPTPVALESTTSAQSMPTPPQSANPPKITMNGNPFPAPKVPNYGSGVQVVVLDPTLDITSSASIRSNQYAPLPNVNGSLLGGTSDVRSEPPRPAAAPRQDRDPREHDPRRSVRARRAAADPRGRAPGHGAGAGRRGGAPGSCAGARGLRRPRGGVLPGRLARGSAGCRGGARGDGSSRRLHRVRQAGPDRRGRRARASSSCRMASTRPRSRRSATPATTTSSSS